LNNQPRPRRSVVIAANAALLVAALAGALVLAELLLRWQEPRFHLMGTRPETDLDKYQAHVIWHHWLRRNATIELTSINPDAWPQPMIWRTNAQGCRYKRDLSRRPPDGARRIIVLGDSFTEGYYQDTTFAAVLERRINSLGLPVLYEVVNCGTSSYSPVLYYLRYKHQLARYHPNELIVNVDLSDLYDDNLRYGPEIKFAADGEPLEARPGAGGLQGVVDNLRYKFLVARLLFGLPRSNLSMIDADTPYFYYAPLTPDSARWKDAVKTSLGYLQRLADLTRSQGVELLLTTYPYENQLAPVRGKQWHRGLEDELRNFAERNHLRFYSAHDDILRYYQQRKVPVYWSNDYHFTPVGQSIWANAFADYYLREKFSKPGGH
jgi:lysophospholipase L1-like esterase